MIAPEGRLRLIKTVHTLAWAFFVTCIGAIPLLALSGRFELALACIGIVTVESVVIAVNAWRCPLTAVAARYAGEHQNGADPLRTTLAVIALALLAVPGRAVHAQAPAARDTDPVVAYFSGWHIIFAHLRPSLTTGDSVAPGYAMGTIEEPPAQQSAQYQGLLTIARHLYAQGQFTDALGVLAPAVAGEPENPFILNEYARALFQIDSLRSESRQYYEQIDIALTRLQNPGSHEIVLDMWFADAYWKLGLLYLDAEDYARAYLQLARVALSNPEEPAVKEQLYGYLAEAAFHLNQQTSADWFIRKALELNPDNQYVLKFRNPQ